MIEEQDVFENLEGKLIEAGWIVERLFPHTKDKDFDRRLPVFRDINVELRPRPKMEEKL